MLSLLVLLACITFRNFLYQIFEISETSSKQLGKMFEGDSADMCGGKFPLMSMGGRAEGPTCVDPGNE